MYSLGQEFVGFHVGTFPIPIRFHSDLESWFIVYIPLQPLSQAEWTKFVDDVYMKRYGQSYSDGQYPPHLSC